MRVSVSHSTVKDVSVAFNTVLVHSTDSLYLSTIS